MMAKLEPRLSPGTTVIFHKTYMPPRFLLAGALASGRPPGVGGPEVVCCACGTMNVIKAM